MPWGGWTRDHATPPPPPTPLVRPPTRPPSPLTRVRQGTGQSRRVLAVWSAEGTALPRSNSCFEGRSTARATTRPTLVLWSLSFLRSSCWCGRASRCSRAGCLVVGAGRLLIFRAMSVRCCRRGASLVGHTGIVSHAPRRVRRATGDAPHQRPVPLVVATHPQQFVQ